MTPKEQLREKFVEIVLRGAYFGEPKRVKWSEQIADYLMAAVEEAYPKPYTITITFSDDQIKELADSLHAYYKAVFAYGCTCGAIKNSQSQQYEGT